MQPNRWLRTLAALATLATNPAAAEAAKGPTRLPAAAPACREDVMSAPTNDRIVRSRQTIEQFSAGDLVEAYDPAVHPTLSFAAQIAGLYRRADGTVGYLVQPGLDHPKRRPTIAVATGNVQGSWEVGTRAACEFGSSVRTPEATPCRILERMPGGGPSDSYGVEFVSEEGRIKRRIVPVARLRRFVDGREVSDGTYHYESSSLWFL